MKKQNEKDLENFKKEVYNYLTQQLGASTKVGKSLMKAYDKLLKRFWEDNLEVSAAATRMWYGY